MLHSQPCPNLCCSNELKLLNAATCLMAYTNSLDFLTTFYGKANPHGNLAWTVAKTIEWSFKLHGILTELIRAWLQLVVADVVTHVL